MLTKQRIYFPPLSLIGPGALNDLEDDLKTLPYKTALFVTDKILVKLGVAQKVIEVLESANIQFVTFDDVQPNPTTKNVYDGLAVLKENQCDFIITLGGGSPQDCGKAIGILATNGGNIVDYEGIGKSKNKSLPIIAINTTAGTASEVTINYVITDEIRKTKMVMVDPNCLASIAVNDPTLMLNKPAALTAATGMDALTHAIEAYVTKGAFGLSDVLALESIRLIGESLETAVSDGQNLEARSKMAWASYIAGLAFSNCGLGAVHSMAHQLGSEYNLPHGLANAILLPFVEEFNSSQCPEKFGNIAKALGKNVDGLSIEESRKVAIDAINELSVKVNIPKLNETSFKLEDVEKLAKQAMNDVCTGGNPREISLEDFKEIYQNAFQGN